jgi:iron(III) transport system permease protein
VNTAILIVAVPTATMFISFLVSWVVIRTQVGFRGTLDTLAFIPHAIPSILIAVGLAYFSLAYRNIFPVYGGLLIIIIAHAISWIAYGTRTINSVMIQVHRELEEAGKVAGLSTPQTVASITAPLIAAGIFNSWIWLAMLSYREVTMALTLATQKNRVISTVVFEFWSNGWIPEVSAMGVVLIFFAVIIVWLCKAGFSRFAEFGSRV